MQHNNDTNDAVQQKMQTLRNLLATGKKNGKLSLKEISDALSVLQLDSEEVDKIYETLENEGIEIEGADVLAAMNDEDAGFSPNQVEEVPEEELVDAAALAEGFAIDDPVRMYLKEIGKVDLLSPDEEVGLAQQMKAGNEAKEALANMTDEEKEALDPAVMAVRGRYEGGRQGQKASGRGQPPSGRLDREALCRTRHALPRPDSGGQLGPHQGGREVRL